MVYKQAFNSPYLSKILMRNILDKLDVGVRRTNIYKYIYCCTRYDFVLASRLIFQQSLKLMNFQY
jgi:hypothetical protein